METFAQAVDKAPTPGIPKELQGLLQKLMGGIKGGASPKAGSPPLDPDMIQKMMGGDLGAPPEGMPPMPPSKKKKKKGPNPRLLQALMSRLGGG